MKAEQNNPGLEQTRTIKIKLNVFPPFKNGSGGSVKRKKKTKQKKQTKKQTNSL